MSYDETQSILTNSPDLGWRDMIAPFSSEGKGVGEPVWADGGNGNWHYRFTAGDESFADYHVQHDYALGTDAYPHVHFVSDTTETVGKVVTWEFAYVVAQRNAGDSMTAARTTISMTYTFTGDEVAGEHLVVECSDEDAFDMLDVDALVCAAIKMSATDCTGNIFGIMCDLHYQSDHSATLNKAAPFS